MAALGLISVIVPVYNGAAFVADAIQSILTQGHAPLEILVIDDGSTDETAVIVQQFGDKVQYHHQANSGSGVARNWGVALAQGSWLAFLDADDVWAADKLHKQTAVFQQNPTVDAVWGHVQEFSGSTPLEADLATAVPGHHPGTVLIKRHAFAQTSGFSTQFQRTEVVEWMTQVLRVGLNHLMLPDVLMYRRLHATNKGRNGRHAQHEYLHVLKQHLDAQRAKK